MPKLVFRNPFKRKAPHIRCNSSVLEQRSRPPTVCVRGGGVSHSNFPFPVTFIAYRWSSAKNLKISLVLIKGSTDVSLLMFLRVVNDKLFWTQMCSWTVPPLRFVVSLVNFGIFIFISGLKGNLYLKFALMEVFTTARIPVTWFLYLK